MIDLHTHTTASDGILEPQTLVQKAKEIGLSAIAITDHDQVKAVSPAQIAGEKYGVEVVAGMELSCYWLEENRKEFHILGYFIDCQNEELLSKLAFFQNEREKRARKSLEVLAELGFQYQWENLLKIAKGSIGRPHIARTIIEDSANKEKLVEIFGDIPQIGQFIEKYMTPGKPAYIEKPGFDPRDAIALIHNCGGVAILAHPCFDIKIGDGKTIKILKEWGIDGLEAIAPFLTVEKTKLAMDYFSKIAQENNLLVTGGSDYHGVDGMGAGLGLLRWGMEIKDEILEKLKAVWKSL